MPADKKEEVRFTVSRNLHSYLGWLSENTMLGKTENEVAQYLLTQRLEVMRQEGYHEPDLPPVKPFTAANSPSKRG